MESLRNPTPPAVEWTVEPHSAAQLPTRWSPDELWALVTAQHGVAEHRQLRDLDVPRHTIARWVRQGHLRGIRRGVYMVGHGALAMRGYWMAAVLACGEGAALSHRCATRLHELIAWHPGRPSVSIPAARRARPDGIAVHRIQVIDPIVVDAIPCTPVARTIIDMAAISRRRTLEKIIEEAHVLGLFDLRAIERTLEGIARPRGVRLLRAVLAEFRPGTTLTRSELEEAMLALCRQAGLPAPVANGHVALLGDTLVKVDFQWPGTRVIVETDSNRYHATHPKRRRDRAKDRALQLAGWVVLRIPEEDLAERPRSLVTEIATALRLHRVDS